MRITNNSGISLPLAVWLIHDEYDYVDAENYISVTTLMKPLKQIILPHRIPPTERTSDVSDYIARKLGNAIHDSIEVAWENGAHKALRLMGYPEDVIKRIVVNPTTEQRLNMPDMIAVWLENRGYRDIIINGTVYTVGGKFDMVSDGILNDNKSTSAYGWVFGTREDEHRLQMSLYRWIDAKRTDGETPRVSEEICNVNYIFTDWQKAQARSNPNYPQSRVEQKTLTLMSLDETEAFIRFKLALVAKHQRSEESDMPQCTDEELWRSAPSYRYFSDPEKAKQPGARSTRNFDTAHEANAYRAQQGKGIVQTKLGEVKACGYCAAFDTCKQKDQYFV
jgi:hypothetical protein